MVHIRCESREWPDTGLVWEHETEAGQEPVLNLEDGEEGDIWGCVSELREDVVQSVRSLSRIINRGMVQGLEVLTLPLG
jgi:hypothetical protein